MAMKVNSKGLDNAIRSEINAGELRKHQSEKGIKSYEGKEFTVHIPKDGKAAESFRKSKEFVEVRFGEGSAFMDRGTFNEFSKHRKQVSKQKEGFAASQKLRALSGESMKTIKWGGYAPGTTRAQIREIIHHHIDVDLSKVLKDAGKTPVKAPEAGPMGPKDPLNQVFGRID